ncbi:MAG TPA: aspartate aminotransferase family protein [Thermoanaerobaculia bacterium]|nr:aspartate aminotransferase family protein [Thermoanaerobaculia bacterium]
MNPTIAAGAGDLPPAIVTPPPGPGSRRLSERIAAAEAPGINTLTGERPSLFWEQAIGANVVDVDGNRFVDLTSGFGVAAVGHRHPRVVAAIAEQADRLLHGLGDVHPHLPRLELAERLALRAPVAAGAQGARVHFGISGAEAVEIAVKTALLVTGRPVVVAFEPAYHGLTAGALALSSRPAFRRPFAPHLHPYVARLPFAGDPAAVEARLAVGDVAAVVVEPVVGREGVLLPPAGWLPAVAETCRRHGSLLVADEVFTGFGRTGRWFAVEHEAVRPDLLVLGKALGGGLPIAAVVGSAETMAAWAVEGEALHTATFVANPLACAGALAVLDVLAEERLVERAARLGDRLADRLAVWPGRFPAVRDVRGRGLLQGIELASRAAAARFVSAAAARGVLLLAGGPAGRVVQIVPPLTVAEEQLAAALDLLEESLRAVGKATDGPP